MVYPIGYTTQQSVKFCCQHPSTIVPNPRLEIRRNRPKNDIGQYLGKAIDAEKKSGKPIRLIGMQIAARAVRLLFLN